MASLSLDRIRLRNTLLLVLGSFIWGTAFVAQSVGSGYLPPFTFLAGRSWLACVFLGVLVCLRGRRGDGGGFWRQPGVLGRGGLLCGGILFAASAAQQMGIGTTSTAKAGFLTALYVVFVPVCGVFLGRRPRRWLWACVAMCVAGLYLLCLAGHEVQAFTGGEWQLILCAVLFTAQILCVDRYSPRLDGVQLSFAQFFAVAVFSTAMAFGAEGFSAAMLPALLAPGAVLSLLYCGIFSSGVAYTLQIVGQKDLDPTIASLAMCLESVWSALAGWVVLDQALTLFELAGCALMFAAIVGSQLAAR